MISHLNGGNCTHEEAEAWRHEFADVEGWDGRLSTTPVTCFSDWTVSQARQAHAAHIPRARKVLATTAGPRWYGESGRAEEPAQRPTEVPRVPHH